MDLQHHPVRQLQPQEFSATPRRDQRLSFKELREIPHLGPHGPVMEDLNLLDDAPQHMVREAASNDLNFG